MPSTSIVKLSVPAEARLARAVRMTASNLAVCCATDPTGEPQPIDLVEVLLGAVCDDFNISEDGHTLHLSKRMGVQHA